MLFRLPSTEFYGSTFFFWFAVDLHLIEDGELDIKFGSSQTVSSVMKNSKGIVHAESVLQEATARMTPNCFDECHITLEILAADQAGVELDHLCEFSRVLGHPQPPGLPVFVERRDKGLLVSVSLLCS